MTPALEVRDLVVGFHAPAGAVTAVDRISFDVTAGQTMAIVGESGCGKSATALALMRLLPPGGRVLGGSVALAGRDLLTLPEAEMRSVRGRGLAMIFQEPATSLNPVLTVGRQIIEVLARHAALDGPAAQRRTLDLLRAVGLADPERRLGEYPFQLSGGMKQRVMIAIALAADPEVLIADEPTTALDVTVQAQILALLRDLLSQRGMGMLMITHDLGIVAQTADRVGVMYAGELVETAPRGQFFASPRHPYTLGLFAALPESGRRGEVLETIPGQVPRLGEMPSGCRFAPRCRHAWSRCHDVSPGWTVIGDGHSARCHLLEEPGHRAAAPERPPALAAATPRGVGPLLEIADMRVHFPIRRGIFKRVVGHVRAVDGVSLSLAAGRTLALVGESGCGKTTVGRAVLQLTPPTAGEVRLSGSSLTGLAGSALQPFRRRMQMVFQDPFASLNPRRSVGEILLEGMQALDIGAPDERRAAVDSLLRQVGLDPAMIDRFPHEFSGGQRQRIAIARVLAVQPELIVCDEPTSALDVSVQAQILNLLRRLQDELGLAYLFITHNFAVVEYLAHDVAVMYLGRIVEQGPVDRVLRRPAHPYTQILLAAVPHPDPGHPPPEGRLAGEPPSPSAPPSGCHFHPRCPRVRAICRESYPEAQGQGHVVRCHFPDRDDAGAAGEPGVTDQR